MNKTDTRRLARLIAKAHAALTALDGGHCHDGRPLPGQERTLAQAVEHVRAAGALLDASETSVRCPEPRTQEKRQGGATASQCQ